MTKKLITFYFNGENNVYFSNSLDDKIWSDILVLKKAYIVKSFIKGKKLINLKKKIKLFKLIL